MFNVFFYFYFLKSFFRKKKIYHACRRKCLMLFFSIFRKYVMHARRIFNVYFYFPKSFFLNKEWNYAMQDEINVFLFSKIIFLKKRICNIRETKIFNIFYFSNSKIYVMYVRKRCLMFFFLFLSFFRNKIKIYNRKMRLMFFSF